MQEVLPDAGAKWKALMTPGCIASISAQTPPPTTRLRTSILDADDP